MSFSESHHILVVRDLHLGQLDGSCLWFLARDAAHPLASPTTASVGHKLVFSEHDQDQLDRSSGNFTHNQTLNWLGRKGRITFFISNRKMLFSFREAALITSITLIFTLAAKLLRLQNSEIKRQKDDITNKFNVFYPPCATAQHNFLSWPHENSWAQD